MRKLTRRSYNRKLIMLGLALFLSVGLISTGFSAWLISSVNDAEATPPVTAGSIDQNSVEVEFLESIVDASGKWIGDKLCFDAVSGDNTGRVTAKTETTTDDVTLVEKLTMNIEGTVTQREKVNKLVMTITLPASIKNALAAKYIDLTITDEDKEKYDADTGVLTVEMVPAEIAESTDGSFKYVLTFTWGEYFDNMNPSEFYDSDTASVTRKLGAGSAEVEDGDGGLTAAEKTTTGKAITDKQVAAEMTEFRAVLAGPEADAAEPYEGTIAIVVAPVLN